MQVLRLDICADSTLSRVYGLFRCSPGSQPSPARHTLVCLQSGQMCSPCQALVKSLEHRRQRRRFRLCPRLDLGFLVEYGKWGIDHPALGASHTIEPVLVGQRFR